MYGSFRTAAELEPARKDAEAQSIYFGCQVSVLQDGASAPLRSMSVAHVSAADMYRMSDGA
jgi:hypothetical protein